MKIVVLGGGIIGTTSAWYLNQLGHAVTVVERQRAVGLETSFANGGQISVSHARPWAGPEVFTKAPGWLGRPDSPILLRWKSLLPIGDYRQWSLFLRWWYAFLRQCTPANSNKNITEIMQLALQSRTALQQLRQQLALQYEQFAGGILHLYTSQQEFTASQPAASLMRSIGLDRRPLSVTECLDIEPALAAARHLLVGGDFTPSDESGDAFLFTCQLAQHAQSAGVNFRFNSCVRKIVSTDKSSARISHIELSTGEVLAADAYVIAMGSYSPLLLYPLGLRLPIIPVKGYSLTLTLGEDSIAPCISLTDDEYKIVISRFGNRLRVAGTAEFNGYDLNLDSATSQRRCALLLRRIHELFPRLQAQGEPEYWCGLRPVTPSGVPYIGQGRFTGAYHNLWLNTGHGTLGWTMACGAGQRLAQLMSAADTPPSAAVLCTL